VTLVPLVIATLFFGIYPVPIMEAISASVDGLIAGVQSDLAANAASTKSVLVNLASSRFQLRDFEPMSNLLAIADATAAIPEIFLAISAMALLMLGVFSSRNNTDTINSLALAALAVTAGLVLYTSSGEVAARLS
jgi:hypothetical protein